MKTEYKGVDWLLDCEPRLVQLEALARSYTGMAYRNHKDDVMRPRRIGPGRARGYAFFMEMRTGKTNTLLNEYLLFRRDTGLRRLLVLAPNKYKYAWKSEAQAFGVDADIHVLESDRRDEVEKFIEKQGEILVVNYEALRSDANIKLLYRFINKHDIMVAADESVLIKNRTTYAFSVGLDLARRAAIVRILTGKPVVQGPHDLWSQLRFIRQIDGFNFFAFRNTFCKMGGFMGKQIVGMREDNEPKLQEILAPCSFRAKRSAWGTSFDSDYETRTIPITPEQQKHYREMEIDFLTFLSSGIPVTADQVLTKHIKLQQISSGFLIDGNKERHDLVSPDRLPKMNELKDSLQNEVTGKAMVVAFYVHSMELLLEQLADYNPALIAGNIMMKRLGRDVEEEKRRFNTDPKCRVLIGQILAIKYGHMLMGTKADPCQTIFYYENTYSLDDRSQSEQRPQGEGQTAAIHIVDFASTKIEREISKALQRKENISERILGAYQ